MCGIESMVEEFGDRLLLTENHVEDFLDIPWTRERLFDFYDENSVPNVFFDGKDNESGASSCSWMEDIYRQKIKKRLAETGGVSPIAITGSCDLYGNQLSMTATFELVDPVVIPPVRAILVIVEDDVDFQGEIYHHLTRFAHQKGITLPVGGDPVTVATVAALPPDWDPANLRCLAFLQRPDGDLEVYQAGRLTFDYDPTDVISDEAAANRSRIDAVWPCPMGPGALAGGGAHLRLTLTETARKGPVRLEILDISGRRVRRLDTANTTGANTTLIWDGRDEGGNPVASGVYWARLTTTEGSAGRRVVVLR